MIQETSPRNKVIFLMGSGVYRGDSYDRAATPTASHVVVFFLSGDCVGQFGRTKASNQGGRERRVGLVKGQRGAPCNAKNCG
jgi:hypothetical protein